VTSDRPPALTLLLGGDVNVQDRDRPESAFAGISGLLAEADVRFVNLEGPLSGPASGVPGPDIPHKPNWRHTDPSMVSALTAARIDVVSCANNVTFPPAAAMASIDVLDRVGIAHCGAGADIGAAHRPAVVERGGRRVAFLAYTSICWPYGQAATRESAGVACARAVTSYVPDPRVADVPGRPPVVLTTPVADDLDAVVRDVRLCRREADIVVVSMHWGVPGPTLADYQITLAHAAIDAGADVVAGHGPHTVQAVEVRGGRPIFYSLGNLVFDWPAMRNRHLDGIVALCEWGASPHVRLVPVRRNTENEVRPITGEPARRMLEHLASLSRDRKTVVDVGDSTATVALDRG
jgi:poly-gamma-glutamate synthesis protein (capsule biosynthesis protein)